MTASQIEGAYQRAFELLNSVMRENRSTFKVFGLGHARCKAVGRVASYVIMSRWMETRFPSR